MEVNESWPIIEANHEGRSLNDGSLHSPSPITEANHKSQSKRPIMKAIRQRQSRRTFFLASWRDQASTQKQSPERIHQILLFPLQLFRIMNRMRTDILHFQIIYVFLQIFIILLCFRVWQAFPKLSLPTEAVRLFKKAALFVNKTCTMYTVQSELH